MNLLRHKDIGLIICLCVVILVFFTPLQQRIDSFLFDALQRAKPSPESQAQEAVFIQIDDESLQVLGRWPWSRDIHAQAILNLKQLGSLTVGYNIAFIEPDRSESSKDQMLLNAMRQHGNIILPIFAEGGRTVRPFRSHTRIEGVTLGHVDIEVDSDGLVRRTYLKAGIDTPKWPSFALAMIDRKNETGSTFLPGKRSPHFKLGENSTWTRDLEVLPPFHHTTPTSFSFIDLLENRIPDNALNGRYVMVGIAASGLESKFMLPSPRSQSLVSGTEIQALTLSGLLNSTLLTPVLSIWGLTFALLSTISFYSALFLMSNQTMILRGFMISLCGTSLTLPWIAMSYGYWLPLACAFSGLIACLVLWLILKLIKSSTESRNDTLTDLANLKMFEETLEIEWEQSQLKRTPLTLILLEIDYYQRFIDTFGEDRGKWVMARVSPLLKEHKRKKRDMIARIDSDSFAVLLPITPNKIGFSLAEKMQKDVTDLQIEHTGSESDKVISLSIGMVTTSAEHPTESANEFLRNARKALYQSVKLGGNQITNASDDQ